MPTNHFHKIFRAFQPANIEKGEPVIVDFISVNGNMFITIHNEVDVGMRDISISFNQKLTGPSGKNLNEINLFKNISFLAAGREFEVFAGRADRFIDSLKDTKIKVNVSLKLPGQKKYSYSIEHDLSIYIDLPQIINKKEENL